MPLLGDAVLVAMLRRNLLPLSLLFGRRDEVGSGSRQVLSTTRRPTLRLQVSTLCMRSIHQLGQIRDSAAVDDRSPSGGRHDDRLVTSLERLRRAYKGGAMAIR